MVEKQADQVRRMFASIAHRYDLLNRLLSGNVDRRWRRFTRKAVSERAPDRPLILDLCTGTGDLALEAAHLGRTIGCDFCRPMLARGLVKARQRKLAHPIWFVEGDALRLPFPGETFDVVSIAFGLRNLENTEAGLVEMFRILRSGGSLAILEFSIPSFPVFRQLYLVYFTRILPRLGALISGQSGPYTYLPASVGQFAQPAELASTLERIGYQSVEAFPLTGGIATLTMALKN
jgi:demethylmenaquinone methyltransferase/2-methoxy-6-polyprenyl-1,4-benzoquinol methylase